MIVFDASAIVGAAIRDDSVPGLALRRAFATDTLAISAAVRREWLDVLHRPRLARFINAVARAELLAQIQLRGVVFEPDVAVADCRDANDNKYLELALAADAAVIVSSDSDLLVLDPWRGRRVLTPAAYLAGVEAGGGAAATR